MSVTVLRDWVVLPGVAEKWPLAFWAVMVTLWRAFLDQKSMLWAVFLQLRNIQHIKSKNTVVADSPALWLGLQHLVFYGFYFSVSSAALCRGFCSWLDWDFALCNTPVLFAHWHISVFDGSTLSCFLLGALLYIFLYMYFYWHFCIHLSWPPWHLQITFKCYKF